MTPSLIPSSTLPIFISSLSSVYPTTRKDFVSSSKLDFTSPSSTTSTSVLLKSTTVSSTLIASSFQTSVTSSTMISSSTQRASSSTFVSSTTVALPTQSGPSNLAYSALTTSASPTSQSSLPNSNFGRLGDYDYFVEYLKLSHANAEKHCEVDFNATLVAFVGATRYLSLISALNLANGTFWVNGRYRRNLNIKQSDLAIAIHCLNMLEVHCITKTLNILSDIYFDGVSETRNVHNL